MSDTAEERRSQLSYEELLGEIGDKIWSLELDMRLASAGGEHEREAELEEELAKAEVKQKALFRRALLRRKINREMAIGSVPLQEQQQEPLSVEHQADEAEDDETAMEEERESESERRFTRDSGIAQESRGVVTKIPAAGKATGGKKYTLREPACTPMYGPKGVTNALEFIGRFEGVMVSGRVHPDRYGEILMGRIESLDLMNLIRQYLTTEEGKLFENVKRTFLEHELTPNIKHMRRQELFMVRRGARETIQEYGTRVMLLAKEVYGECVPDDVID